MHMNLTLQAIFSTRDNPKVGRFLHGFLGGNGGARGYGGGLGGAAATLAFPVHRSPGVPANGGHARGKGVFVNRMLHGVSVRCMRVWCVRARVRLLKRVCVACVVVHRVDRMKSMQCGATWCMCVSVCVCVWRAVFLAPHGFTCACVCVW